MEEELRYYNFMSMMSYSDYMIFEEDVRAGRRDINEPYAISWR